MAFGGHERERFVVGIDDQDAAAQPHGSSGQRDHVQQGHFAWGDPREWAVEPALPRPERCERPLPGGDELLGRDVHALEADPEGLLPELAEPLKGSRQSPAADCVDGRPADAAGGQAIDGRRPVRRVARSGHALTAAIAAASSGRISIASSSRVRARIWR